MSARGEEIVRTARGWLGTPYLHQASCKGAGADCLGLLRGIWREVHGTEPVAAPPYTPDWSEPQHEERLWHAAERHLQRIEESAAGPGDVVLFRMRETAVAKHLGVLARRDGIPTFIHSYSGHGVVESPLSASWSRRIVATFAFHPKEA